MLEARADVVSWVKEAYLALRTNDPTPVLDRVWAELGQADMAFSPILGDARRALRTSEEQLRASIASRDRLTSEIGAQKAVLEARTLEVQQLQATVEELRTTDRELRATVGELRATVQRLDATFVRRVRRRARRQVASWRSATTPRIRRVLETRLRPRRRDVSTPSVALTPELRETLEGEFDRVRYLALYADVRDAGMDPLEHYLGWGWREGRDPSSEFSTSYYLSANPDVAAAEIHPFVHYVRTGRSEGRLPLPPGGFRREAIETLRPLDEEIDHWRETRPPVAASVDEASLTRLLVKHIGTRRHVVLSCSHDDYMRIPGGVQLCLQLEQAAFVERDCAYLNLRPAQQLPVLARETRPEAMALGVACDGELLGAATADAVLAALTELGSDGIDFGLVVHALHGHSPEVIAQLYDRVHPQWAWLWLHDFFVICPSTTLLRNTIEPCHAPAPESAGCMICVFGEERLNHVVRLRELLDRVPFKLVAPSQFMADRWREYFGNDQLEVAVHEHGAETHAAPDFDGREPVRDPVDGPPRIAFVGNPSFYKGWGVFRELVRRYAPSGEYRFFHFGDWDPGERDIEQRRASVVKDGPLAMIDALRTDSIELAVVWSLVEESFGFTTREAFAAGAAVITNEGSGNVASVVEATGRGLVFRDEAELLDAFESGSILEFIDARRSMHDLDGGDFALSNVTADLAHFDD
jgi:hypothetical protein